MSRFDDFAKSRAEGRGLFSALKRTRPGAELDGDAGVSRRDLMKKAGLVTGAAVVGSTLIQSVTSPAYAASVCTPATPGGGCGGTCPTTCANGISCTTNLDCASGTCSTWNQTCLLANGSTCTGTTSLAKDQSCGSGYCGSDGKCANSPVLQPTGATCHGANSTVANSECVANNTCTNGKCLLVNGQVCQNKGDCASDNCAQSGVPGVKVCQA